MSYYPGSENNLRKKEDYEPTWGPVETLKATKSMSLHLQESETLGFIQSMDPATKVWGDFRGKDILELRVSIDI